MTSNKQVLVIDVANGALAGVMEELDELGFRVIWVPDLTTALDFIQSCPTLMLVIASAAVTQAGAREFLYQAKEFAPKVRIIWGTPRNRSLDLPSSPAERGPDSLIPEPFHAGDLRTAIFSLLAEHFYPRALSGAVQSAALEVSSSVGKFRADAEPYLVANQTELADVSAMMPFTGGVSGHLMVGMSNLDARIVYQRFVPGSRSLSAERLEDMIGELCNQILGRINAFFVQRQVTVQHGTPIFIRASGSTLRYPGRQPSLALGLVDDEARISLEYYLADFDRSGLASPVAARALVVGEVRYL